jgi:hypothetical protein
MDKNIMNISNIETYLNDVFDGVVSNNTFFTTYPDKSIVDSSDWQDMVLIDIPGGINDLEAYGKGFVFVGLYARPQQSGKKNVAKMSQLEERLNEAIANAKHPNYVICRDDTHSTYDDDINWHCNVVTLIIKIY